MVTLGFGFFVLVMALLLAGETSLHLVSTPHISIFNSPVETVIASHLQIALRMKSSEGAQKFHTMLHRDTDSPRETLTWKGYNFPLKFRKDKFVALENGNKATFDCQVEPPFIGNSKPWIELDTGNIYCIFFPYSKVMMKPLKKARHVSPPASFALLLRRLSVSGTGKMMNITSELNNVLENSDVQIHWRKKDYLSMSLWDNFGIAQSEIKELSLEDQINVTLSATSQRVRMIIRYEMDESQIPVNEDLVVAYLIKPFFIVLVIIIQVNCLGIKLGKQLSKLK